MWWVQITQNYAVGPKTGNNLNIPHFRGVEQSGGREGGVTDPPPNFIFRLKRSAQFDRKSEIYITFKF